MTYRTLQLPPLGNLNELTQLLRDFNASVSQSRLCAVATGATGKDAGKNLLIIDESKNESSLPTLQQFPGANDERQLAAAVVEIENDGKLALRSYGSILLGTDKTWVVFLDPPAAAKITPEPAVPLAEARVKQTDDNSLNVRNGPSMKAEVIDELPSGRVVGIYEEEGIWRKIAPQEERWVSSLFLAPVTPVADDVEVDAAGVAADVSLAFDLPAPADSDLGAHEELWGTCYYILRTQESAGGIVLRDSGGSSVGPAISQKSWCLGAMEGTIMVVGSDGKSEVYNYEGKGSSKVTSCAAYFPNLGSGILAGTERVTWKKAKGPFGDGASNYLLSPYRTLAVDKSEIPLGTALYIPDARGVAITLPDGSTAHHDGYFFAGDVGGAIKNNHVDFFIGVSSSNPFGFVQSKPSKTVAARRVTNATTIAKLKALHT